MENKLYYKFVEYGERVKEQRAVDEERAKSKAQRADELAALRTGLDAGDEEDQAFKKDESEEREYAE